MFLFPNAISPVSPDKEISKKEEEKMNIKKNISYFY